MTVDEQRANVRGNFPFKINYRLSSKEEYQRGKMIQGENFAAAYVDAYIDLTEPGKSGVSESDHAMLNYLFKMDQKLDLILSTLSKSHPFEKYYSQAVGVDVSGTGMRFVTEHPIQTGQILYATFMFSDVCFVFVEVFCEVIHTEICKGEHEGDLLVGVRFLNLSVGDREKIISTIFQKNRDAIRQIKQV